MSGWREAAGIHDFDEGPQVLNVEHVRSAIRDTDGRHLMLLLLLLRAQERQLSGVAETATANLLVINSSATREDSISRVLVEEAVLRLTQSNSSAVVMRRDVGAERNPCARVNDSNRLRG